MRIRTRIASFVLAGLLAVAATAAGQEGALGQKSLGELKKLLTKSLQVNNLDNATLCVHTIAQKNSKEAVEFLVTAGLRVDRFPNLDQSEKVRVFTAARESLPKVTDEGARNYLFKEAKRLKNPKHQDKKVFLTEIIGKMDGKDAEEALIGIVGQPKIPAAQIEAIEALGRKMSVEAVDHLIGVVERREKDPDPVWKAAGQALVQITGHYFHSAADWRNWWAVRKNNFDPKKHRGNAKVDEVKTREKTVPTFFDEEILSKRVVFIIDISKSMHVKDPPKGGEQPRGTPDGKVKPGDRCPVCGERHRGIGLPDSRMRVERVKRELLKMLENMDSDTKFNILAFSTDVLPWAGGDELLQATDANLEKAKRFVQALTFEQYTSTDYALERAFAHREANAFYLLSDGTPYRDRDAIPKEPILDMVRLENKTRKVKIYTLGFSEEADKEFMKTIAKENGGTFKPIN